MEFKIRNGKIEESIMRSYNLFTRFFIAVVFTTITSLAISGFSAKQAYDADPDIVAKLEKKYDMNIQISGMGVSISDGNARTPTEGQWELTVPAKKLIIKSYAGDVTIKNTNDKKIRIMATGKLDTKKSSKLLVIDESADQVIVTEPENAVQDLVVRMEIPAVFAKDIEVTSVSGNISLENMKLSTTDLKTVSGDIILNKLNSPGLKIESVSGDTKVLDSKMKTVNGKSVSGDFEIENKDSAETHLNSVSGDVKLKLPTTTLFDYRISTVSGDIKNSHEKNNSGNKTTSKLGIEIDTTSGDIEIE